MNYQHPTPLVLALAIVAACAPTQRYAAPMDSIDPLPASNGAWYVPGSTEVEVWRHSDPVKVRRAGTNSGFPMSFFRKVERVRSGSVVQTAPGGRAEVLWPVDGTSIMLFDEGVMVVTEPSRDEPTAVLLSVSSAKLQLTPEDRIMLPGGAILAGDDEEESGPFALERHRGGEILRLKNQSKHVALVRYLDRELQVFPSEMIDLPLLPGGTGEHDSQVGLVRHEAGPLVVHTRGEVEAAAVGAALAVRATGPALVHGLGVTVFLAPREGATFRPLGTEAQRAPAAAAKRTDTEQPAQDPVPAVATDESPGDPEPVDDPDEPPGDPAPVDDPDEPPGDPAPVDGADVSPGQPDLEFPADTADVVEDEPSS